MNTNQRLSKNTIQDQRLSKNTIQDQRLSKNTIQNQRLSKSTSHFHELSKNTSQIDSLASQIDSISNQLSQLPKGELIIKGSKSFYRWYVKKESELIYISRKERAYAEQLALKKYLHLKKTELSSEMKMLDKYNMLCKHKHRSSELLVHPEYQKLLAHYFVSESQALNEWSKEAYSQNMSHPEALLHTSPSGHLLRSKSEAMIDMLLYFHRIPFRYECELNIGDTVFYPDFTIRHPKTGEYIYWEHFGMMDNPGYAQAAMSKLHFYSLNKIYPSINLITTFETKEHPLTEEVITKTIQYYF